MSFQALNGTLTKTAYGFINSPNTGIYSSALGSISVAANGVNAITFASTAILTALPINMNIVSATALVITNGAYNIVNVDTFSNIVSIKSQLDIYNTLGVLNFSVSSFGLYYAAPGNIYFALTSTTAFTIADASSTSLFVYDTTNNYITTPVRIKNTSLGGLLVTNGNITVFNVDTFNNNLVIQGNGVIIKDLNGVNTFQFITTGIYAAVFTAALNITAQTATCFTVNNLSNMTIFGVNTLFAGITCGGTILPTATTSFDIGSSSFRFNQFYSKLFADNGTNVIIGATMLPTITNTYDIGSNSVKYRQFYSGLLVDNGTNVVVGATILSTASNTYNLGSGSSVFNTIYANNYIGSYLNVSSSTATIIGSSYFSLSTSSATILNTSIFSRPDSNHTILRMAGNPSNTAFIYLSSDNSGYFTLSSNYNPVTATLDISANYGYIKYNSTDLLLLYSDSAGQSFSSITLTTTTLVFQTVQTIPLTGQNSYSITLDVNQTSGLGSFYPMPIGNTGISLGKLTNLWDGFYSTNITDDVTNTFLSGTFNVVGKNINMTALPTVGSGIAIVNTATSGVNTICISGNTNGNTRTFIIYSKATSSGNSVGYNSVTYFETFNILANGNINSINGTISTLSDRRLKTNIVPMRAYLSNVNQLQFVGYDLNFTTDEIIEGEPKSMGLIAQDTMTYIPEIVAMNDNGNYNISYTKLIPIYGKCIQELSTQVTTLQADLAIAKSDLAMANSTIAVLSNQLTIAQSDIAAIKARLLM